MLDYLKRLMRPAPEAPPRYPALEGVTAYVVGDIHGCLEPLRRTLGVIDDDRARRGGGSCVEVFLGDYVDRGPDSAGVIDLLIARSRARGVVFIKGNHDALMEEFARGRRELDDWLPLGGAETLRSYGATPDMMGGDPAALRQLVPRRHLDFLRGCIPMHRAGGYAFVHAGVRPGVPLAAQAPQDLMWIRDDFLKNRGDFGAIVVHGHTPVAEVEFRRNRIGVDTGAYMTGRLSCLRIDGAGPAILAAGT